MAQQTCCLLSMIFFIAINFNNSVIINVDTKTVNSEDLHLQCDVNEQGETEGDGIECPEHLIVHWLSLPPYFYDLNDATSELSGHQFSGVFHEMLYHLQLSCQQRCLRFDNSSSNLSTNMKIEIKESPIANYNDLLNEISLRSHNNHTHTNVTEIFFPLASPELSQSTFFGFPFIFQITSPGVVLIRRAKSETLSSLITTGVKNSWQMLALIMLFAVIVGVFVWLVEHQHNADFPLSFTSGCWTGFWFAWVTMTTVGYGDKTPKSMIGRVLAVLWMLIGLCLFPILVANFTSALQASSKSSSSIDGSTVSVIKLGPEIRCALEQNANVIEKNSYIEVLDAVANFETDGALIEKHAMRSLLAELKSKDLRPLKTFNCPIHVGGVAVPHKNMTRQFTSIMDDISNFCVPKECRESLVSKELTVEYQYEKATFFHQVAATAQYDLHMLLLGVAVIALVIILSGLLWQIVLSRQTRKKFRNGFKSAFMFASLTGSKQEQNDKIKIAMTPQDEISKLKDEFLTFSNRFIERLSALDNKIQHKTFEMTTLS